MLAFASFYFDHWIYYKRSPSSSHSKIAIASSKFLLKTRSPIGRCPFDVQYLE
ncbi:hypothetical protein MYAER_2217 [Microcystis aeruginosa NIES-2549]|uniref:Uncharacterized protein n=1 Tax=Microcystis aeruginosa NIES-2549 TaxID=1641812 RepID=A0A0F6RLC2_MICAE|nr:hypothetical protein MYAER_2217 [Microcystis aeruginosa NIES-2549]